MVVVMRNQVSEQKSAADEYLFDAIRKIGLIAACIDLHNLRQVIDDVLSEVAADNQKADVSQSAPQPIQPSNLAPISISAIRRTSAATHPRLVMRSEQPSSLLLVSVSKTSRSTECAA